MATSSGTTLLNQAISRILGSWTDLQTAISFGFGNRDIEKKLVDSVEAIFNRNSHIDIFDVQYFLEDELDDKFNISLEDDSVSVQMISGHICECFKYLQEGRNSDVEQFLQGLPNVSGKAAALNLQMDDDSSSDEDEDEDGTDDPLSHGMEPSSSEVANGVANSSASVDESGDGEMEVDPENDGWTVVQTGKGKKKR